MRTSNPRSWVVLLVAGFACVGAHGAGQTTIKDAESAVSQFEEALTRILEGDAIQVGAG